MGKDPARTHAGHLAQHVRETKTKINWPKNTASEKLPLSAQSTGSDEQNGMKTKAILVLKKGIITFSAETPKT